MDGIALTLGKRNLPVIIHPEFWTRRRVNFPGRAPFDMPVTSKTALREAGFEIIESREPSFLLGGALLVTGEVARTSGFEKGFPGNAHEAWRGDHWEPDPLVLDDQALIAHVKGRGLAVLTGCGHAGVVNIVRHAMRITGENRVHAVVGGFHLTGGIFEAIIPQTVAALREIAPDVLVPAHCTGWKALGAVAAAMPEAFIMNSVGTRFELRGA
jgi:7,8-dihydropterin-6-yl-methyl-4-(beta-D-ribofuranosyl)aminobenzene 5'-phosphate synthase